MILSAHCPMKPLRALPEEIGFYLVFKWCLVLCLGMGNMNKMPSADVFRRGALIFVDAGWFDGYVYRLIGY